MSDEYHNVDLGEDEQILLISPHTPEEARNTRLLEGEDGMTLEMAFAIEQQLQKRDPELTLFQAAMYKLGQDHNLVGGMTPENIALFKGSKSDIEAASEEVKGRYDSGICSAATYSNHLFSMQNGDVEIEHHHGPAPKKYMN